MDTLAARSKNQAKKISCVFWEGQTDTTDFARVHLDSPLHIEHSKGEFCKISFRPNGLNIENLKLLGKPAMIARSPGKHKGNEGLKDCCTYHI